MIFVNSTTVILRSRYATKPHPTGASGSDMPIPKSTARCGGTGNFIVSRICAKVLPNASLRNEAAPPPDAKPIGGRNDPPLLAAMPSYDDVGH